MEVISFGETVVYDSSVDSENESGCRRDWDCNDGCPFCNCDGDYCDCHCEYD